MPGIEPGLHAPKACVLPVYYTPTKIRKKPGLDGSYEEHRLARLAARKQINLFTFYPLDPKARILPLYHSPNKLILT